MPQIYRVKQGDCVESIAFANGLLSDQVWMDDGNEALRSERDNRNVLLPGDRVSIPEIELGFAEAASGARHRFRRLSIPAEVRLQIFGEPDDEEEVDGELEHDDDPAEDELSDEPIYDEYQMPMSRPSPSVEYRVETEHETHEGQTDSDGCLSFPISPDASAFTLTLGEAPNEKQYRICLGAVDPVNNVRGCQQRLFNLGYDVGPEDNEHGPRTRAALISYQRKRELSVADGELNEETQQELLSVHGS